MRWSRRQTLRAAGLAAGAALLPRRRAAAAPGAAEREVKALYRRAPVIDMLGGLWPEQGDHYGEADLALIRDSGLSATNITIGIDDWDEAIATIAALGGECTRIPERLLLVRRRADLDAARKAGALGLILGTQGSLLIGRKPVRIDELAGLGLRVFQLTYNRGDLVGDGCLEPRDAGLTRYGLDVLARLEAARVAVDLSHCGARTTLEAIRAAKRPPLVTHAGCAAVFAHPRNKEDATLKELADRGGAIGVYLMPFLGRPADGGPATLDMALDHLEHALKVCGEDHVGIGTDSSLRPYRDTAEGRAAQAKQVAQRRAEGISAPEEDRPLYVPELNHPRRLETIALGLARRGQPLRVIEKLLGGNFRRVLGEIWGVGMRVLVTGATGFIGSHVLPRLLAGGHQVRALCRPTSDVSRLPAAVEVIRGELDAAAPACVGIEGLVHLAGISGSLLRAGDPGRELRKVNVEDTSALFRAAADAGARRGVLVTSMWTVLRPELAETSPYVRSRFDSEQAATAFAPRLETAILCPTFVVGAGDRGPNFPGAIVRAFARGRLPVAPPGGSTWIAAADVAVVVGEALLRGEHGRRYLLGAEYLLHRDLGAAAARFGGVAPPRWTAPWPVVTWGGRATDAALRLFGRRAPIPFGAGIDLLCQRQAFDCSDTWRSLAPPAVPVVDAIGEAVAWFGRA